MRNYDITTIPPNFVAQKGFRIKMAAIVNKFIEAAEKGEILTEAGNKYSKGTIRTYKTFLRLLNRYEDKFGTVFLNDINIMWAEYFKVFLTSENLTKNSIFTNMARLKSLLNRAYLAGLTAQTSFGIKVTKEHTEQVYLTMSELRKVYNFEFMNAGEKRIRDIFVMHCFTGMRISDYLNFVRNPLKYIVAVDDRKFIKYQSEKTNVGSVAPIHFMVQKILEENNYNFGKNFSYQHYNYYLKIVMKKAGIDDQILTYYTKGGEMIEEIVPKWKKVSSHTARRTFASLAELAKIPRPAIMKITGHKTEQSFLTYIRISNLDSAMTIMDDDFFKIEL